MALTKAEILAIQLPVTTIAVEGYGEFRVRKLALGFADEAEKVGSSGLIARSVIDDAGQLVLTEADAKRVLPWDVAQVLATKIMTFNGMDQADTDAVLGNSGASPAA
jgi:hypothetical protein